MGCLFKFDQPESDKTCALWEQELASYTLGEGEGTDIEADAEAFAWYLLHRYPVQIEIKRSCRRISVLKRKYDKVEIAEPAAPD